MRSLLPCVICFLVLTPLQAAEADRFDIATFRAPPGWARDASPGMLSFRSPQSAKGFAQIFLFSSRGGDASPEGNFRAEWARLITAPVGAAVPRDLHTNQTPSGWTVVTGAADVSRQGASFTVLLVTATSSGRTMSIVTNVVGDAFLADIQGFFQGVQFAAVAGDGPPTGERHGNAAPADAGLTTPATAAPRSADRAAVGAARIENNAPAGLFYQLQTDFTGGARLETEARLFLPGNRIARLFPFGGGDTFDLSRCSPDTCGSFKLESGRLTISWDNGQVDRHAYAASADSIQLDGRAFKFARPVAESALAGEWRGAGSTGASFSNVYRFERNGRFTFGAAGSALGGRYRVQGLTLTLKFDDGSVRERTLFAAGSGTPPGLISIDKEVYARAQ
jgi:hypothetical protein